MPTNLGRCVSSINALCSAAPACLGCSWNTTTQDTLDCGSSNGISKIATMSDEDKSRPKGFTMYNSTCATLARKIADHDRDKTPVSQHEIEQGSAVHSKLAGVKRG
jgi:hypothetical protein